MIIFASIDKVCSLPLRLLNNILSFCSESRRDVETGLIRPISELLEAERLRGVGRHAKPQLQETPFSEYPHVCQCHIAKTLLAFDTRQLSHAAGLWVTPQCMT